MKKKHKRQKRRIIYHNIDKRHTQKVKLQSATIFSESSKRESARRSQAPSL